ncbi:MAG: hypothetical protein ACUVSD_12365 [Thiobacillaceae bacterium]
MIERTAYNDGGRIIDAHTLADRMDALTGDGVTMGNAESIAERDQAQGARSADDETYSCRSGPCPR